MISIVSKVAKMFSEIGKRRSIHWPAVRSNHLRKEWWCRVCGHTDNLEVHHVAPFHLHPELELDESNLITLCEERGTQCHLKVGHLGSWMKFNPDVRRMAVASPVKELSR